MQDYSFVKLVTGSGTKAVSINDLPPEAWQHIVGKPLDIGGLEKLYQYVAWLYRGVHIRANALAKLPFSIFQGKKEVDSSDDYQNVVGVLPHPHQMFRMIEACLTIYGYAYVFKRRNLFMQNQGIRYLLPTSVTPKIDKKSGKVTFKRNENGIPKDYSEEDMMYFWSADPFVEIGEPTSSPAKAAANAAGVLLNVDTFAQTFFKQGAVKVTILTTENILEQERQRLKAWWKRVTGAGKSWQTEIVNASRVNPVVIGEGLESLTNTDLTEDKRMDIAAALGIPYSVLYSNASNRATAEQDDKHLYDKTVIPDAEFIAQVFNEQLLDDMGYRLAFNPQEMEIFQQSEAERADSLQKMMDALTSPEEFLLAAEILGFDIPPEVLAKIEELATKKEERRQEMMASLGGSQQNNQQQNEQEQNQQPGNQQQQNQPPGNQPPVQQTKSMYDYMEEDLMKWKRKALNRLEEGRPADCPFSSETIDPVTHASIKGALEVAKTEEDVEMIFSNKWVGYA